MVDGLCGPRTSVSKATRRKRRKRRGQLGWRLTAADSRILGGHRLVCRHLVRLTVGAPSACRLVGTDCDHQSRHHQELPTSQSACLLGRPLMQSQLQVQQTLVS